MLKSYLKKHRKTMSPLTDPCMFCNHNVSRVVGNFPVAEPRSDFLDFAYELYRNLFYRFGFHFHLTEDYNKVRRNTTYSGAVEESVWGLSYVFRIYYKTFFAKWLPCFVVNQHKYEFFIAFFGKRLFREHVCPFKFLVFCGFLSELSAYFHRRDIENVLRVAPKRLKVFFDRYVSTEFYSQGGWDKLQKTAEVLSMECRRFQNNIDFDPEIEKFFFSREQIMDALDIPRQNTEVMSTEDILEVLNEDQNNSKMSTPNV